jgi:hypothetical protein
LYLHTNNCSGKHKKFKIQHEHGEVDTRDCDSFIINGSGAPAADGFCGLQLDDGTVVQELHQSKHIKDDVDLSYYQKEYSKAAGDKDLFILFTTHDCSVGEEDLPNRGGIVCRANFDDYFGPFLGRAFREYKVDINNARRSQLEAVSGIGPKMADKILMERNKNGPYKDKDDFKQRTNFKRTFSEAFSYSTPKK